MKKIKIEVIGAGCKRCKSLFDLTQEIVKELNINSTVLYNTDITKISFLGLMSSPVLTINDKPVLVGILPDKDKLKEIIYKSIFSESTKIEMHENNNCGNCSCGNNINN